MLAARDQENLVYAHQNTAVGKPLNQGVRGLQPKTPGKSLKTPFRPSRNDENRNLTVKGAKPGLDKNTFVTPVGPRNRAPLGAKTTNAKAIAFNTPAAQQKTIKPLRSARQSSARRSLKSKITIAPSEPVSDVLAQNDGDLPEPEYAPPNPIELPDPPIDIQYNQDFPQLRGMNLMKGYGEVYGSPTDESGMSLRLKRQEEIREQFDRDMDQRILDTLNYWPNPVVDNDKEVDAMIAAGPKKKMAIPSETSTMREKAAASALARSTSSVPLSAKNLTASTTKNSRKPAFSVHDTKKGPERNIPSYMRSTAAAAVSRNTIGFPKAKKPASIIPFTDRPVPRAPQPTQTKVDQSKIHPREFIKLYGTPPIESEMWFRLKEHELIEESIKDGEGDELADDLFGTDFFAGGDEADGEDDFQLPMP